MKLSPSITIALIALAVFLAVRIVLPSAWLVNESTDYVRFYEPVARQVVDGKGLTLNDVVATDYPPGFPIVLAAVFKVSVVTGVPETMLLPLFFGMCFAGSAVLLHHCGRRVWGTQGGVLCAMLWVTNPLVLWLTKQPNSELPFATLLFGSVLVVLPVLCGQSTSATRGLVCGMLAGCASLVRPIGVLLGGTMALVLLISAIFDREHRSHRGRMIGLASLVLVGNLAAILPWEIWVHSQTGRWIPLSTAGNGALRLGLTFAVMDRGENRIEVPVPESVLGLMERAEREAQAGRLNSGSATLAFLRDEFEQAPSVIVRWSIWKAGRAWYGTDSGRHEDVLLVVQLGYLLIIISALIACFRSSGAPRWLALLVLALTVQTWALTTITFPIARYMMPMLGLLFLTVPALFARRVRAQ